jgi:phosphotransferase system  glucose/maltose/N-acetylglucosamine-specific IIC component
MNGNLKNFTLIIYFGILIASVIVWVISANDLLFHYSGLTNNSITFNYLGNWNYWIFTISLVLVLIFAYYTYVWIKEDKKFITMTSSESKQTFVKNLKSLEKIARKHGSRFQSMLNEAKEKWKVR